MDRPGKFLTKTFWIIPLIFYWYTACRYPGWVDAPMIAWHVDALATGTWVNSHSLFYIIGKFWTWIFPWGDYHFRLNLLCGVLGAITVHFVFLTAVLITENVLAALLGGLALMLSHSLWWHSTMLEVYTLNTALLSIILFLVAKFSITKRLTFLYLSLFFWGLSIVNHVLMGLLIVGFMAFFLLSDERKRLFTFDIIIKSIFFVFCGAQIYIFLFLKDVNIELSRTADFSYPGLWHSFRHVLDQATGGHFKGAMFPTGLTFASQINWKLNYIFLLIINFPSVFFILDGLACGSFLGATQILPGIYSLFSLCCRKLCGQLAT